jgi:thiol-disulfide isomerase/thioredoxin
LGRRAVLALLGAGGLVLAVPGAATTDEVPIGGVLRDAPLQGLNGPSRRLSQFRGRSLLINVWASWCGPCIEEMASIERLAWMEGRPPFAMIGVSTDDYPEPARAFLRRSNATISHFIDNALQIENMLGAARIPLTVLVGADGHVLDKIYGAREWDGPDSLRLLTRAFGRTRTVAAR